MFPLYRDVFTLPHSVRFLKQGPGLISPRPLAQSELQTEVMAEFSGRLKHIDGNKLSCMVLDNSRDQNVPANTAFQTKLPGE